MIGDSLKENCAFVKASNVYNQLMSSGDIISSSAIIMQSQDLLLMRALCYLIAEKFETEIYGESILPKIMSETCSDIIDLTAEKVKSADIDNVLMRASYTSSQLSGKYVFLNFIEANDIVQNKFLKTLESPRDNSKFILLTNQSNALLPTIKSRCNSVEVKLDSRDIENIEVNGNENYAYAIYASRGNMTEFVSMLKPNGANLLINAIGVVGYSNSQKDMIKAFALFPVKGDGVRDKLRKMCGYLERIYDDLLKYQMGFNVNTYGAYDIERLSKKVRLGRIVEVLTAIRYAVKRAENGNLLSVVDELIIKIWEVNYNA